jgi:O-antigen/teichoic acid export membrane protein
MNPLRPGGLLGAVSATFLANWAALAMRFALSVLVFRLLGASVRGEYSVVVALGMILGSALQLGLPGNAPFLLRVKKYSRWELHVAAWIVPLLVSGAFFAVRTVMPGWTSMVFRSVLGMSEQPMVWATMMMMLAPPIAVATAVAAADSEVGSLVMLNTGSAALTLVLAATLGALGCLSLTTLLAVSVSSQAGALALVYSTDYRLHRRRLPHWNRKRRWFALLRLGTSGSINNWINLVFKRMDILIVNRLLGSDAAGVYAISQHFQEGILSVPRSSLGLVIGRLTRLDPFQALAFYTDIAWKAGAGFAALALVGAPVAALATVWLLPQLGPSAAGLSAAMLAGGCLQAYAILLQSIFYASGHLRWITGSTMISVGVFLVVSLLCIQPLGVIALPLGLGLSAAASATILWSGRGRCLSRNTGIAIDRRPVSV